VARVNPDALHVPLQGKPIRATGETLLRAEVLLLVLDAEQNWHLLPFRADSATEITTMPATIARNLLGLTGVVDKVTLVLDGNAADDAPYGHLVIEPR
jgi:hypothetical protein